VAFFNDKAIWYVSGQRFSVHRVEGFRIETIMRPLVARYVPLTRLFNKTLPQGSVLSGKR